MKARWMGQLFGQYGIAMWEGYPQWDIYDGELTYSAVTENIERVSGMDVRVVCRGTDLIRRLF